MVSLFKKGQSYLGVDLGSGSVKIVELEKAGGKAKLLTYGLIDEANDVVKSDAEEVKKRAAALISAICKKARTKSKKAVAGLPNFSIFSSTISLPKMSRKELSSAIHWEAKKFIPLPIEEVTLDWQVLSSDDKNTQILLTAAPKNLVRKYVDILNLAGLEFLSLETESFALTRVLVGRDPSPVAIIDIGALVTNINIVENGVPIISRSIDVGGATLTKSIAGLLNIDLKRAEQFKRDIGVPLKNAPAAAGQGAAKAIETTFSSITNEIKYIFELYGRQNNNKKIEKIILTGGSSQLGNLPVFLEEIFGVRVIKADPFSQIVFSEDLRPVLDEVGARLAVAAGLAMREII